jgi:integrase
MPKLAEAKRGVFEKVVGSGVWWIRYADITGKIRRTQVGSRKLAEKLYKKHKQSVRLARLLPPAAPDAPPIATVGAALDDVLARKGHKNSVREYERAVKIWKAAFGDCRLDDVTPGDIEQWCSAQYSRNPVPAVGTVNRHLAFLKLTYNCMLRDQRCTKTPFLTLKFEKENNARVRFLSEDEETRLLAAILEERHRLMTQVAMYTGMRQGEQFGLTWDRVDLENNVLTIPRSKHGESRIVYLNGAVLGFFTRLRQLTALGLYVFPSETGTSPVCASNFHARVWKPALERARIFNFRWHDLRHTFGARLAMAGASEVEIAHLMGHKSTAMTWRYMHLAKRHLHDTVGRLDAYAERALRAPAGGSAEGAIASTPTSTKTDTAPHAPS